MVEGDPALAAIFFFDLLQAGLAVRAFPQGLGSPHEQEEQAIEQRECRLVKTSESSSGVGFCLEARPRTPVGQFVDRVSGYRIWNRGLHA